MRQSLRFRPSRSRPIALAVIATLAVGAALSGCATGNAGTTDGLRATSVLLDWTPNPDHVALYTAQQSGDYRDAGLDVTFTSPSGTADAAKSVSLGQTDLAISYEPDTLIAESEGLDVISVAALIPTSLTSLMTYAGSGITSAADLGGKRIGISGLASQEATIDFIARSHGVDPQSIQLVNLTLGLNQPLIDHQVDATFGAFRNIEGVELAAQGDFPAFSATQLGVPDSSELVVIAQRSRLQSDSAYAQRVGDFLAATAKGQETAVADPDSAISALTGPTDGAYDAETLRGMVQATLPLLANDRGFGQQSADNWAAYATWMRDNGLLTTDYNGADGHTNDYLPQS